MRHSWVALPVTILAAVGTSPVHAAAPPILSSTFLGGSADENERGVRIGSDGSIFLGTAVLTAGAAGAKGTFSESHVIHLDRNARKVLWDIKAPEEITDVLIDGDDAVYAIGVRKVYKLSPKDGAIAATSKDLGGPPISSSLGKGELGLLVGGAVVKLDTARLEETGRVSHDIPNVYAVLMDRDGGVYAGGDSNPGTGCEPWRVPRIYHFDKTGKRDWRFWDYPGPIGRYMTQLQSDSSVRGLATDASGRLWFRGWSDGYNTIFPQKYWNVAEKNPFLNDACFPNTCIYPHGARSFSMVGRLLDTYNEVARATWWAAFAESERTGATKPPEGYMAWMDKQPTCGCKDSNVAWPTSTSFSAVRIEGDNAVIVGGADKYPPTTPDAWYGRWVEGSHFIGILDQDLTTARFGAVIPGSDGGIMADTRGGRLVVATSSNAVFKPASGALQATFGGGNADVVLVVACLAGPNGCDGAMPALAAPAKAPVAKPEPPLPTFNACDKSGMSSLASGMLPDFGVDYSMTPKSPPPPDSGGTTTPPAGMADGGRGGAGGSGGTGGMTTGTGGMTGGAGGSRATGGRGSGGASSGPDDEMKKPAGKSGGCTIAPTSRHPDAETLLVVGLVSAAITTRRRRRR